MCAQEFLLCAQALHGSCVAHSLKTFLLLLFFIFPTRSLGVPPQKQEQTLDSYLQSEHIGRKKGPSAVCEIRSVSQTAKMMLLGRLPYE